MSDINNLVVKIKEASVQYGEWSMRISKERFSDNYRVFLKHCSWSDSTRIDMLFPTYKDAYEYVKEYVEEVAKISKKDEENLT